MAYKLSRCKATPEEAPLSHNHGGGPVAASRPPSGQYSARGHSTSTRHSHPFFGPTAWRSLPRQAKGPCMRLTGAGARGATRTPDACRKGSSRSLWILVGDGSPPSHGQATRAQQNMHRAEAIASQYDDGRTCFHSLACMVHGCRGSDAASWKTRGLNPCCSCRSFVQHSRACCSYSSSLARCEEQLSVFARGGTVVPMRREQQQTKAMGTGQQYT